mgnify:CR=1 FL=1|tara:strand:- start:4700 stop:4993 length:294 start_codon:yes stop_codon:yes gene_type:complete
MKSNKLIAEFMGCEIIHNGNMVAFPDERVEDVGLISNNRSLMDLHYHTSWDWLRPVVLKIEQDCEGVPQEMLNISLYSDIDEVYESVVEFIKNQNKK